MRTSDSAAEIAAETQVHQISKHPDIEIGEVDGRGGSLIFVWKCSIHAFPIHLHFACMLYFRVRELIQQNFKPMVGIITLIGGLFAKTIPGYRRLRLTAQSATSCLCQASQAFHQLFDMPFRRQQKFWTWATIKS